MKVCQAESGALLPLKALNPRESLETLRQEIFAVTSIPPVAQILLTATGTQVKQDTLDELLSGKGPSNDDVLIYVFNRQLLDSRTAAGGLMPVLPDLEPPVPHNDAVIPDNVDAVNATSLLEDAFRSHCRFGQATLATAKYHYGICERLLSEQTVQTDAFVIALTNLQGHSRSICEAFDVFYQHAQREIAKHTTRIQSFPIDMQALSHLPVHPAIADGDKYLADYVPRDKLVAWAENCRTAHSQLVRKVAALADTAKAIRTGTDSETSQPLDVDLRQMRSYLAEEFDALQRIEAKQQRLERDLTKVEEILNDIRSNPGNAHEKLTSLKHLRHIHHQDYLPQMMDLDESIRKIAGVFIDSKAHLTQQLISRLQLISHLQSQIATVMPTLNNLASVLNAHIQAFAQLLHVHRMPAAWGAALVEIVRRREFVTIFLGKAKEMAEVLARFRMQEERRRETFRTEIGRYLPAKLINGMEDKPPYCEVSFSNTTDHLPELSREDIAAFERLVSTLLTNIVENEAPGTSASHIHSNHTISKLIATMVKMSSQLDATSSEFDRILSKSGFSDRMLRLEEENLRLRGQLHGGGAVPITSRAPSSGPSDAAQANSSAQVDAMVLKGKLAECEARCAVLGSRNGDLEATRSKLSETERELEAERNRNHKLEERLREMMAQQRDHAAARHDVDRDKEASAQEATVLKTELDKLKHFLTEVEEGVQACSSALHRQRSQTPSPEPSERIARAPNVTTTPDEVRRSLRELQDEILCQTAQLAGVQSQLREHDADSDIVALATQVGSLTADLQEARSQLRELREHLTATEAHEAVIEADLGSTQALLKHAQEDLVSVRQKLAQSAKAQMEISAVLLAERDTKIDELQQRISSSDEETRQLRDRLSELTSEKESLEENAKQLGARVTQIEDEERGLQERYTLASNDVSRLEGEKSSLREELAALQVRRDELEAELTRSRAEGDQAFQTLRTALENSQAAEEAARGVCRTLETSVSEKQQQLDDAADQRQKALESLEQTLRADFAKEVEALKDFKPVSADTSNIDTSTDDIGLLVLEEDFKMNDLALFLPTRNPKAWAAFNVNAPHYFLSPEVGPAFAERMKNRDFILAYITDISEHVVEAGKPASNPFGLAGRTRFRLCGARGWGSEAASSSSSSMSTAAMSPGSTASSVGSSSAITETPDSTSKPVPSFASESLPTSDSSKK
ncbi:hypothetical protein DFS34DRAFT_574450 [Phlyctochytrium arcticum]|nr:hypothetical protein DFS34DRAFT_574450 [Phlyctochytrium arcticum]